MFAMLGAQIIAREQQFGAVRGPSGRLGGSENDRVNNMNEQQFQDHMNELHMRDNIKPINANLLT